jgi:hypothetical protein
VSRQKFWERCFVFDKNLLIEYLGYVFGFILIIRLYLLRRFSVTIWHTEGVQQTFEVTAVASVTIDCALLIIIKKNVMIPASP